MNALAVGLIVGCLTLAHSRDEAVMLIRSKTRLAPQARPGRVRMGEAGCEDEGEDGGVGGDLIAERG